jgi:hypothetical protein
LKDLWFTGTCMVVYYFLWSISLMMPFFVWRLSHTNLVPANNPSGWRYNYSVLQNYYRPNTISNLRASQDRIADHGAIARKIDELMDRHGSQNWIEPFLHEVGPSIQAILSDLANTIEAVNNLYHFYCVLGCLVYICRWLCLQSICWCEPCNKPLLGWTERRFFLPLAYSNSLSSIPFVNITSQMASLGRNVQTHAELCFQHLQERSNVS